MSGDESAKEPPAEISPAEFQRWYSPPRAIQILGRQWEFDVIYTTLTGMLYHGQLYARAGTLKAIRYSSPDQTFHNALIPSAAWPPNQPDYHSHFWQNGRVDYALGYGSTKREFACFNVRFDPDVIDSLVEVLPEEAPEATPAPVSGRRGARRKHWWDHLWIEMIRRIRAGTLNPKSVGELFDILEQYARNELNEDPGDGTLKPMASNLFKYLEESGGK